MNIIKLAYRKLFRKGENTSTRIISLTAGSNNKKWEKFTNVIGIKKLNK